MVVVKLLISCTFFVKILFVIWNDTDGNKINDTLSVNGTCTISDVVFASQNN